MGFFMVNGDNDPDGRSLAGPAFRRPEQVKAGSGNAEDARPAAGKNVLVLIGPEGDFDSVEIKLALEQGFKPVSLGESRLRTETAGIVACHTVCLVNQI